MALSLFCTLFPVYNEERSREEDRDSPRIHHVFSQLFSIFFGAGREGGRGFWLAKNLCLGYVDCHKAGFD